MDRPGRTQERGERADESGPPTEDCVDFARERQALVAGCLGAAPGAGGPTPRLDRDGLHRYRLMVRKRLRGLLIQAFPVARSVLGEEAFDGRVQTWLDAGVLASRQFWRIPVEFAALQLRDRELGAGGADAFRLDLSVWALRDAPDPPAIRYRGEELRHSLVLLQPVCVIEVAAGVCGHVPSLGHPKVGEGRASLLLARRPRGHVLLRLAPGWWIERLPALVRSRQALSQACEEAWTRMPVADVAREQEGLVDELAVLLREKVATLVPPDVLKEPESPGELGLWTSDTLIEQTLCAGGQQPPASPCRTESRPACTTA